MGEYITQQKKHMMSCKHLDEVTDVILPHTFHPWHVSHCFSTSSREELALALSRTVCKQPDLHLLSLTEGSFAGSAKPELIEQLESAGVCRRHSVSETEPSWPSYLCSSGQKEGVGEELFMGSEGKWKMMGGWREGRELSA